ncbi:MAG: proteasome activator [Actinomycetes bacterium]
MSDFKVHTADQVLSANEEAARAQSSVINVGATSAVTQPAKVMRIGAMVKQLLEEVRGTDLDQGSRERLAEIYERSIVELTDALSPDLQQELTMLALPFSEAVPSEGELRIAQAQLVGWLEGLFHGIQAALFAQQVMAQQQMDQIRQLQPSSGDIRAESLPNSAPLSGTYL